MKISKHILSAIVMLFILTILSSTLGNLPGEPVVPSSTITKSYYITGREVVGVGMTHTYYAVCLETETDAYGFSSTSTYSPSASECQWTVPSGFSASYVQYASCIVLTAPSSPSSSTTLQVNVNGIASEPKQITVVGVSHISASADKCFAGDTITLQAMPSPAGVEFPSGFPVWSSVNLGSQIGTFGSGENTATGGSTTWTAPTGNGGYANITLSVGTESRSILIPYVKVEPRFDLASAIALRRGETFSLICDVEPPDVDLVDWVALSSHNEIATSYEKLSTSTIRANFIDTIDASSTVAFADKAASWVESKIIPENKKILGFNIDLYKKYYDWWYNVEQTKGEYYWGLISDQILTNVGNLAYDYAINKGYYSPLATVHKNYVVSMLSDEINATFPFSNLQIPDLDIKEDRVYTWSVAGSTTTTIGTFKVKQTGYPGWPEVELPSAGDILDYFNSNGFGEPDIDVNSSAVTFTLGIDGGSFRLDISGSLIYTNEKGDWEHVISVGIPMFFF
ncbi:MAG: hypothetical protein GX625_01200 [Clostridiaceae bacterium]|nr:hypothetical protein [Clostridiaceae bacterium]